MMERPDDRVCPGCEGTHFSRFAAKGIYSYERCDVCGLLAIEPMPSEAQIAEHYAQKFQTGNYATIRTFATAYRSIYRQYVTWMSGFVRLHDSRCLDIGCFTGELIDVLLDEGKADAYGVELQDEAASIAEARFPDRVFRHNIDHPSAFLPDGSFDVITMMGLIEHVQRPGPLLSRARALLKEGGWLFLETPNASSLAARASRSHWPPLAPVEHLHLFSERAIQHALERSGFRMREVRAHVKRLPVAYVYEMLQHFGPEWRRLLTPLYNALPHRVQQSAAPFYAGEMLVAAQAVARPAATG
jgi:2-polyprenyl-3-methyl-5-hydroxy-6-metoxy-1,4-benzoquinol methylase